MRSDAKLTPPIYTGPLKVNVGDGVTQEEGRSLLHVARVMLGKALSAADAAGNQTTSSWHTFENGVTVRVARIGGIHIAEFVRHPDFAGAKGEYDAFGLRPYGGVVVDGYYDEEQVTDAITLPVLDRFTPSTATLKWLNSSYTSLEKRLAVATDSEERQRLQAQMRFLHHDGDYKLKKVPYLALHVPDQWKHLYNNPITNPLSSRSKKVYSQYRLIKPTMYSGRMRVVAQILLGFGRQPAPTVDQQRRSMHALHECWCGQNHGGNVVADEANMQNVEDYGHWSQDTPPEDKLLGSLNYWFHWYKTHGVYKTDEGRYYLIEIGSDGVWAMRLPVLRNSKWALPEDAKDYLSDLPLGYGFPRKVAEGNEKEAPWDRAKREGWLKQLLTADDLAPFYEKLQPTYAECGWAFSLSGKKIDNVGWRINAPRPYDYPVFEHWHIELRGGDKGEKVTDYCHNSSIPGFDKSIETLTADIRKVGEGNAVDVSQWHKPFKIPKIDEDTGIPGVVSFDMNPRGFPTKWTALPPDYAKAVPNYPVSDTVVHVFYDGEELVWTRFYNPMNTTKTESDSWDDRDYQPYCMLLGGFTWGSYTRPTTLPKGFYSNRLDPRKQADESRLDLQSAGRKTWESPYMGVEYSWPYPPFHFGYEQSNDEGEWYNSFDASYRSRVGSPWTAKRHCFHVHVWGTRVTGQSYAYACALPLTDREAAFICERHVCATRDKIDYQYAAMVMQFVYYTYPSWIPDYELGIDHGIIPVGNWEWWQLRDDTVKYLMWKFFDDEHNYTKEQQQPIQTVLNIVSGTHTAPLDTWDRGKNEAAVEEYKVYTLCSKMGGEYPKDMQASAGASQLWEAKIPDDDGFLIAHFWCTRSMLGAEGSKQHIYLNGRMEYVGVRADVLDDFDKTSPHRQVTFIGET